MAKLLSHIGLSFCHYLLVMSSSAEALTLTGALILPCGSTYWLPVCGLDASWTAATRTQICWERVGTNCFCSGTAKNILSSVRGFFLGRIHQSSKKAVVQGLGYCIVAINDHVKTDFFKCLNLVNFQMFHHVTLCILCFPRRSIGSPQAMASSAPTRTTRRPARWAGWPRSKTGPESWYPLRRWREES